MSCLKWKKSKNGLVFYIFPLYHAETKPQSTTFVTDV